MRLKPGTHELQIENFKYRLHDGEVQYLCVGRWVRSITYHERNSAIDREFAERIENILSFLGLLEPYDPQHLANKVAAMRSTVGMIAAAETLEQVHLALEAR